MKGIHKGKCFNMECFSKTGYRQKFQEALEEALTSDCIRKS